MTYNDKDNERAHIIDSDEDLYIFTPTFPENSFDVLYFFPLFFINFMKSCFLQINSRNIDTKQQK
jgi:hypothetical protein